MITDEQLMELEDLAKFKRSQAYAYFPDIIERLKASEFLLASVERRIGSASMASAYTDAMECAEWIRLYFAKLSGRERG